MKNILLLCESFSSANYHVMISIIRSVDKDAVIHVVADTNEKGFSNCDNILFYPVGNWRISFIERAKTIRPSWLSRVITSIFYRATKHLINLFPFSFEREMYRQSRQIIKEYEVKNIFSVCFRFYSHRVAKKLTQKYNLQWFQFWLDPFSNRFDERSKIWRFEAECIERKLFHSTKKIYALPEVFIGNHSIECYKNKLVTFQIPYLQNRPVSVVNKSVVFAGGFIKNIREPGPVLDLLMSVLQDVDQSVFFDFYVRDKYKYETYNIQSKGRIRFHDFVNRKDLYKILSESYMLLNIGNYGIKQMPSKTVEYVSFRKPILFFHKGSDDSSLQYLSSYPDVCMIDTEQPVDFNSGVIVDFFRKGHADISYDELMNIQPYFESTPQYIRSLINLA